MSMGGTQDLSFYKIAEKPSAESLQADKHENAPGYTGNTIFPNVLFDMHIMMKSTC